MLSKVAAIHSVLVAVVESGCHFGMKCLLPGDVLASLGVIGRRVRHGSTQWSRSSVIAMIVALLVQVDDRDQL